MRRRARPSRKGVIPQVYLSGEEVRLTNGEMLQITPPGSFKVPAVPSKGHPVPYIRGFAVRGAAPRLPSGFRSRTRDGYCLLN